MKFPTTIALLSLLAGCATGSSPSSPATVSLSGKHVDTLIETLGPADVIGQSSSGTTYQWQRRELVETASYGNYKRTVEGSCILVVTTDTTGMIMSVRQRGLHSVCMGFDNQLLSNSD